MIKALLPLALLYIGRQVVLGVRLSEQPNLIGLPTEDLGEDVCSDRLCYGLPMGCQSSTNNPQKPNFVEGDTEGSSPPMGSSTCSVLVTSKRVLDSNRPASRDIHFELIALPVDRQSSYAAVGFSENGRMQGLVTECLHFRDPRSQTWAVRLRHSYNTPGDYRNIPVHILGGIKTLETALINGRYQCKWLVESAVEFNFEAANGSLISRREDLGYKNYHILLATGEYNEFSDGE